MMPDKNNEWLSYEDAIGRVRQDCQLSIGAAEFQVKRAIESGNVRRRVQIDENSTTIFDILIPKLINFADLWWQIGQQIKLKGQRSLERPSPDARRRGPKPKQRPRIIDEMRALDRDRLISMTEEEMTTVFKAARSTCAAARNHVLSEIADK